MAANRLPFDVYAKWVAKEVMVLHTPGDWVRKWIEQWGRTYNALDGALSYFELVSIIAARWEFMGGLYLGTVGDSGNEEAVAYVARFIEPIQARYGSLHDVTGRGAGASDFFTMFRNKPFHGMTPAPSAFPGDAELIGWWIGTGNDIAPSDHLTVDAKGNINVNCGLVRDEMLASMKSFADYLDANTDQRDSRLPRARMQRSFWSRNKPRHYQGAPKEKPSDENWMTEGLARGVPA